MGSLSRVARGYRLSKIAVLAWWLFVLAAILGVQVDVVTRPLPAGARFISPLAQTMLLFLFLSVPLVAGLAAGWRRQGSREGGASGVVSTLSAGLLVGLAALPALVVAFAVLDLLIESIIAEAPNATWGWGFPWPILIVERAAPAAAVGALLGGVGGLVGGLIAARGGSARARPGVRRPA
jgi:hypothetical protein